MKLWFRNLGKSEFKKGDAVSHEKEGRGRRKEEEEEKKEEGIRNRSSKMKSEGGEMVRML